MKYDSHVSLSPNPSGDWPRVDPTAYVDPTARVIGAVCIGPRVFVGPGAVIRADEAGAGGKVAPIVIESECNVQDNAVIHALAETSVMIGPRTSLAHACIIHGPCTLGEGCFIGFGAKVFDAVLADGVYVGMSAVVRGVELAADSSVPPTAGIFSQDHVISFAGTTTAEERSFMENVVTANLSLVEGYNRLGSAVPG